MNNFAPVLIPTLNRHVHFKRCVESLSACTHADKTDLFIFLDYPLKDAHREGYELIKAYLPNIKGFKTVNVIEREKNYGAVDNFFKSIEYGFERYDRILFSEDDNEFSPNFLDYINKGLDLFNYDKRIQAICGFKYPINDNNISNVDELNYFYAKTFSAWGFGIWRDRYKLAKSIYTPKEILDFLKSFKNIREIYNMAPQKIKSMLNSVYKKKELYGDGIVSLENIKNNTTCVYPTISKVLNHGHDGSGEHCVYIHESIYNKIIIDKNTIFDFTERPEGEFDKKYKNAIKAHFRLAFKNIIILPLLFIIVLLKNQHDEIRQN